MRGVRLGTVLGIPIRLDWSVVAIFGLITWSLSASAFPELVKGYSTREYWAAGITTATFFFVSLLAHEISHSVVARRLGIGVRDITLWLFGGVSTIEGEAHSPRDEMKIAIAGPLMSVAIAFGAIFCALVLGALGAPALLTGCLVWLGTINLVLAIFNLAPAAPLDGGRVLHAWLWHRRGDRASAGVSAARAGRGFGWFLIALGFVELATTGGIGGIWFALLGWFLHHRGAGRGDAGARHSRPRLGPRARRDDGGSHHRARRRDGRPAPRRLRPRPPLLGVPPRGARRHPGRAPDRRPHPDTRCCGSAFDSPRDLAWPMREVTTATPDELLLDVLRRAGTGGDGRILVFDGGELVGIVSPTDVARAIQLAELARA